MLYIRYFIREKINIFNYFISTKQIPAALLIMGYVKDKTTLLHNIVLNGARCPDQKLIPALLLVNLIRSDEPAINLLSNILILGRNSPKFLFQLLTNHSLFDRSFNDSEFSVSIFFRVYAAGGALFETLLKSLECYPAVLERVVLKTDKYGQTILHKTAKSGQLLDSCQTLFNCLKNHRIIVEALIKSRDNYGKTANFYAHLYTYRALRELFREVKAYLSQENASPINGLILASVGATVDHYALPVSGSSPLMIREQRFQLLHPV